MDDRHHTHRNANGGADPSARGVDSSDADFGEALLSAYLDGECTASQQAQVEERIAASAELRQLVDELRSVRSHLELLPQYRLEPNFAEHVLRRAEREVLVGEGNADRDATVGDAASPSPVPVSVVPSEPRAPGRGRPLLWTLAALAAAVLILVTNREPVMRRDPIAQGPAAPTSAKGARTDTDGEGSNGRTPVAGGLSADDETDRKASPLPAPMERANINRLPEEQPPNDSAIDLDEANVQRPGEAAAPAADKETISARTARTYLAPAAPQPPASRGATEAIDIASDPKALRPDAPAAANGATAAKDDQALSPTVPPKTLRIVEVAVERDAWQRKLVENVLAKNGIALYDTISDDALSLGRAAATAAPTQPVETSAEAKKDNSKSEQLQRDGLELVVVSATSAQVEAALGDFGKDQSFRVLQVTDASAPLQHFRNALQFQRDRDSAWSARSRPLPGTSEASKENFDSLGAADAIKTEADVRLDQPVEVNGGITRGLGVAPAGPKSKEMPSEKQSVAAPADAPANKYNEPHDPRAPSRRAKLSAGATPELRKEESGTPNGATDRAAIGRGFAGQEAQSGATAVGKPGGEPAIESTVRPTEAADSVAAGRISAGRDVGGKDARGGYAGRGSVPPSTSRSDTAPGGGVPGSGVPGSGVPGSVAPGDAPRAFSAGGYGGGGYGGGALGGGFGGERGGSAGSARFAEVNSAGQSYGSAGGGVRGGGVRGGGAMPADDGAAAVADTKNLPTGYGQRFLLNQSAEYYQRQQTPTYGFGVSPEGVRLQTDSAQTGTLAPEQVLFVFRVVDTPLAKPAVEATKANAAATSPVRGAGAETTGQGDRANAPLAAPGNSAK